MLTAEYRQPFDMLALARKAAGDAVGEGEGKTASLEKWLPGMDGVRTFSSSDPYGLRASCAILLHETHTNHYYGVGRSLCHASCAPIPGHR